MKRAGLLVLATLNLAASLMSQTQSSMDLRQSTGNGPFPIYLGMQWVHSSNQQGLERLLNPVQERFGGYDGRVRLHGFEVTLGAMHNTRSFLWCRFLQVHGLSTEISYKYMARGFDDPFDNRLRIRERLVAFRVGYRMVIYYPFTIHVQAGPIVGQTLRAELADESGRIVRGATVSHFPGLLGADIRARLVLFDPVGAAGGFGLWVEGQFLYLPSTSGILPLYSITGSNKDRSGNLNMGIMSIGVSVPLALRLR